jgi:hypothetical protein
MFTLEGYMKQIVTQLTAIAVASKSKGIEAYTLESPELLAGLKAALSSQDDTDKKWEKAANLFWMAGVRAAHITEGNPEMIEATRKRVREMVVSTFTPTIQSILASPKIALTSDERTMHAMWFKKIKARVDILANHLRTLDDAKNGKTKVVTMAESMANKVQEMIDQINKAPEKKLNFDASEAVLALKKAKAVFQKN